MTSLVGGEPFTDYPITLANLSLPTQNSNQQAPDATSFFSCWWDAYRKQFTERLSEKSGRCGIAADRPWRFTYAIDRGDIRQAIDRCSNIWASLPGAGYGQFEHKADSLDCKFKEAGGTVREIDV